MNQCELAVQTNIDFEPLIASQAGAGVGEWVEGNLLLHLFAALGRTFWRSLVISDLFLLGDVDKLCL